MSSATASAASPAVSASAQNASGNSVILMKDFDISQVNFEQVTRNAKNGKSVRITYGPKKQPLRIQLPDMAIPFEIKQMSDDLHPGSYTYTFEVALNGYDEAGSKVKMMYDKLRQLDELIINTCVEKSAEWLGESKRKEVVEEFHKKLLRQNNPKYSPLLRVKAARMNNNGDMPKVFDKTSSNTLLAVESLTKGARAQLIVTIPTVWLINKNFGASVKLYQACITSRPMANNDDYAFCDDEEEAPAAEAPTVPASKDEVAKEPAKVVKSDKDVSDDSE